jgi:predicted TPR repeat methyltransferase
VEGTTTAGAPSGYVREVFDGYAENIESHLMEKLGCRIPELLAEAVDVCIGSRTGLSMLDLGCGTGLMGLMLRERCARLVGVDPAPKMVAKSRAKGLYTELAVRVSQLVQDTRTEVRQDVALTHASEIHAPHTRKTIQS